MRGYEGVLTASYTTIWLLFCKHMVRNLSTSAFGEAVVEKSEATMRTRRHSARFPRGGERTSDDTILEMASRSCALILYRSVRAWYCTIGDGLKGGGTV
jgi:hypothetical protein